MYSVLHCGTQGCSAVRGDEDLQSLGYAMSSALNYVCQNDGDGIVSKSIPNAVYLYIYSKERRPSSIRIESVKHQKLVLLLILYTFDSY